MDLASSLHARLIKEEDEVLIIIIIKMKNHGDKDKDNSDNKSIYIKNTCNNLPTRQSYHRRSNQHQVSSSRHRSKNRSPQQDLSDNKNKTTTQQQRRRRCKTSSLSPPFLSSPRRTSTITTIATKTNKMKKKINRTSRNYISNGSSLSPSSCHSKSSDEGRVIPERLSTVLCRSKRGTPSGALEQLALTLLYTDQDEDENSSLSFDVNDDATADAVVKTVPLLSDPTRIPLNLHW